MVCKVVPQWQREKDNTMHKRYYLQQPWIALALWAIAVPAIITSWFAFPAVNATPWKDLLVAVCLLSAVVIAGRYPIHIRYHTKVSITSIPLYLLAVLLQPPL
ncbi:MAG: hypothetical protein AVDCRST_MAG93-4284, partial [uncultured Chloroflexia bacterium]